MPPLYQGNALHVGDRVRAVGGPRLGHEGRIAMSRWQEVGWHVETGSGEIYEADRSHRMKASSLIGLTTVEWDDGVKGRYKLVDLRHAPARPPEWDMRLDW